MPGASIAGFPADASASPRSSESGQAAIFLILVLGIFLLALFGFAVDLTNIWFHRQAAIAAADAACQAGALDMLAISSGETLTSTGFTAGTASDCVGSPSATMCTYSSANGYAGTGLVSGSVSNAVSWTFPAAVSGVTAGVGTYPFLQVTIAENVKTYFISLLNASHVQRLNTVSTCGNALIKAAAPMLVLNPILAGTFNYSGGGELIIVGGPQRGLQVNSSNPLAIGWLPSGLVDLSLGGPKQTGSDVAVVGGPTAAPSLGSSSYNGGTTGNWKSGVIPIPDPFSSIGVPTSILSITPSTTVLGTWVAYGVDGCPDHTGSTGIPSHACKEFGPGYYPLGINLPLIMNTYSTAIFRPGIYYLGASFIATGSNTLRIAKPSGYAQTDGVMFYFNGGTINISGCSGCTTANIDNVAATDLTCNGSAPMASLGMASTISGNVLYGQCTAGGTYWDAGGDTTDSASATGSRGLLIFQDHSNLSVPILTGSGSVAFSGVLYFHSFTYLDLLSISGGASSGTYVLGQIVADQVSLTGSGIIRLALSPSAVTPLPKVSIFN